MGEALRQLLMLKISLFGDFFLSFPPANTDQNVYTKSTYLIQIVLN